MPKKYPTLTPRDVKDILKANGFVLKDTEGSHEQYEGVIKGIKRKVTVDITEKDFGDELISSMIRQSGLSRNEFYCSTKHTAKKINKKLRKDLK